MSTAKAPQIRQVPRQIREGSFLPASVDAARRTVELVWSTGSRVRRMNWWTGESFDEELSLDPKHVDLSRLASGRAPLLNSHSAGTLSDVLGVVEKAWLTKDGAHATVRFSERPEVEPIFRDVRSGIIRNVSVGYDVKKFQVEKAKKKDDPDIWRAVSWQPAELSLVPIGADAGAQVRAQQSAPLSSCLILGLTPGTRGPMSSNAPNDLTALLGALQAQRSSGGNVQAILDLLTGGTYDLSTDEGRAAAAEAIAALQGGQPADAGELASEELPEDEPGVLLPSIADAAIRATGKRKPGEVLGALQALSQGNKEIRGLAAKVAAMEAERGLELVASGVRSGKITPAQRSYWEGVARQPRGLDTIRGYLSTALAMGPGRTVAQPPAPASGPEAKRARATTPAEAPAPTLGPEPAEPKDPRTAINAAMKDHCRRRGYDDKGLMTFATAWVQRYGDRPFVTPE